MLIPWDLITIGLILVVVSAIVIWFNSNYFLCPECGRPIHKGRHYCCPKCGCSEST